MNTCSVAQTNNRSSMAVMSTSQATAAAKAENAASATLSGHFKSARNVQETMSLKENVPLSDGQHRVASALKARHATLSSDRNAERHSDSATKTSEINTETKTVHNSDIKKLKYNLGEVKFKINQFTQDLKNKGRNDVFTKGSMQGFIKSLHKLQDEVGKVKGNLHRSSYKHNPSKEKALDKISSDIDLLLNKMTKKTNGIKAEEKYQDNIGKKQIKTTVLNHQRKLERTQEYQQAVKTGTESQRHNGGMIK